MLVAAAVVLFWCTYALDRAAYRGAVTMPSWVNSGSADAARQVLTAIAAAVITVTGVVFSITIVALTLASTQFGPRMLRNFIRDRGTQLTLGIFVATFVYDVLALGSISTEGPHGEFVPHLTITIALALLLLNLGVLIYFIHHVTRSIQLPQVVASIAHDLDRAIEHAFSIDVHDVAPTGLSVAELIHRLDHDGGEVLAPNSGYLQYVGYERLVSIAAATDTVVRMLHRPGHFVVRGRPLAVVWPADGCEAVAAALARDHVVGPHRTLQQDLVFASDQLVEIAIRALSPAVNDTFTALTCTDWLTDGLCKLSSRPTPDPVRRDAAGRVRLIQAPLSYERIVRGAFDKIRQAGRGMPAVTIRQLEGLTRIVGYTTGTAQRTTLAAQAEMLLRSSVEAIPEPSDRGDVQSRFDAFSRALAAAERQEASDRLNGPRRRPVAPAPDPGRSTRPITAPLGQASD